MNSIDDYVQRLQPLMLHQLPRELRRDSRFVLWNPEFREDGTLQKVPYRARPALYHRKQYPASSTNPKSWATFEQARKAYLLGGYAGLGRVASDTDVYPKGYLIYIDLDHCLDKVTRQISAVAREILDILQTYSDESPTDGVHSFLFCREIPAGLQNLYYYKGQKIEIYWKERYLTLTGRRIAGTPSSVEERQANLVQFLEQCERPKEENTGVCVLLCDSDQDNADTAGQVTGQALHVGQQVPATEEGAGTPGRQDTTARSGKDPDREWQAIRETDLPMPDQLVLQKAREARNAANFRELWEGRDPKGRTKPNGQPDTSAADFDLILTLLYWSNDDVEQTERLFRASKRYRPQKTDRRTAGIAHLRYEIQRALARRHKAPPPAPRSDPPPSGSVSRQIASDVPQDPEPQVHQDTGPTPEGERQAEKARDRRRYQVINYAYDWMRADFDQAEWNERLYELAQEAKSDAAAHFETGSRQLYTTALPPGIGKSHAFGELCDQMDLAVIVPRHELIAGVPGYRKQRHIQTANEDNCPSHENHHRVASLGYNTKPVHKEHDEPCDFELQFQQSGSAMYQIAHAQTCYISGHEGIIVDEFNLPDWLNERIYSVERLASAAHKFDIGTSANRYLVAWQATLTELAHQGEGVYQGRAVYDLLNKHLHDNLSTIVGQLNNVGAAIDSHPWPASVDTSENLPEVILPHVFLPVFRELVRWQRGTEDFNSCIRVTVYRKRALLRITTTRAISATTEDGTRRAIAMADATAHREILESWYGGDVEVKRIAQDPPPHMKHIHLAERCAKRSMQASHGRDQARAIRKVKFFLNRFDPDGEKARSGKVGLITYLGNEEAMREALGIPEGRTGHFWAMRGSNALESCEILLIVGTPTLAPETVYRIARTLYRDDPRPIVEGSERDETGRPRYLDYRVQELNDYLTSAELTQCAHRHRPLRYDGRILVSICDSDIDYLPVTHFVSQMPRLTNDGEDAAEVKEAEDYARLDQARRQLEAQNIPLGVHRLGRAAGLATDTAARYLREWRATQAEHQTETQEGDPHTQHTHTCVLVPENAKEETNSIARYDAAAEGSESAPDMRPGTPTTPPHYGRPCSRCGHVDDWVKNPTGQAWVCSCYYWWYDQPERRKALPIVATQ